MSKEVSILVRDKQEVPNALQRAYELLMRGLDAGPAIMSFSREKRSPIQNRKMWGMCRDISEQVQWHGMALSDEDWKQIVSAEVEHQRIVPGISVPFIALGVSTRKQSKRWFSDFFECAYAFGSEHNVEWKGDSLLEWASEQEAANA